MNYQFCSPLHRHWHWCDRNNIPRNDDVPQKVDQTFTNLNLPVKRTPKDEALPPEVQLAMVRLLGMSMDTARTKTMNSLNEHVYIGLVRTICKHTKEQFNDYAWPIQATNKIITMHLNNEFDLGPTAHRQTKSNFEANMLQLDQYLTWLQDQNKPYRPTVSSLTLAKSKQSEPQRKTPGTIKPPQIKRINKTILNTFQTVEDYKQAIPTHMQNPDDIKYIATRSKK